MIEQPPGGTGNNGGGTQARLTEPVCAKICKLLKEGIPQRHAARSSGISETTFTRWMQRGEVESDEGLDTPYTEFRERVLRAKSDFVTSQALIVNKHARGFKRRNGTYNDGDYRAAQWLLERRGGEEWMQRERVENVHEGMINHRHELVIPDDQARLLEISNLLGEIGATAQPVIEGTVEEDSEKE